MHLLIKDHSGGRICFIYVINSEEWQHVQWGMAPQLFWLDVWIGLFLQEKLPRLFSFAKN
jgi:hypothetical protein